MDKRVDEPATDDQIGESGEQPGHAGIHDGVEQIYAQGRGKIAGHPGEQQIESVIVGRVAGHEAFDVALAQEVDERAGLIDFGVAFGLRAALADEFAFGGREGSIFAGITVDPIKEDEIEEAENAGGGETPAPPEMDEEQADERDSCGGAEFCGGVENGGGEAAFASWGTVPTALELAGKVGASPTPSRRRAAAKLPTVVAAAAPKDATLQRKVLTRPTNFTPKRSSRTPQGSCSAA